MPTAIKETTVTDLIQELQNLPQDAPVTLRDGYGETFVIVGFEGASDGVKIIISDDGDDDEDSDDVPA
ncbi:hypothetical protein [uncultured Nostoc sp.]|uniref:hypothetical protein n=1 Tax=uncultured Nostoc sp. TaxID=340711 RepID=UPI0035CA3F9A